MKCFLFLLLVTCFCQILMAQDPHPINGINMKKNTKWPSQPNGKTVIEVSWDNSSPSTAQERQWVKEAIKGTWEKYINVEFVGWGASNASSKGIRIVDQATAWPHTAGLGNNLDGMAGGMVLTFEFQGVFTLNTDFTKEENVKFIAVHEFGHALGFAHEQNRPDCLCKEAPQGEDGDFYLTPCDINSVMNYCNPKWSNYGQLSSYDIVGAQAVYGKPQASLAVITSQLSEIRLIPCSPNILSRVKSIKDIISASKVVTVNSFTQETDPVPQKAVDGVPGLVTIRYFSVDDAATAAGLKNLLVLQGYNNSKVVVQDWTKMSGHAGYIEIWAKEQKMVAGTTVKLSEIRLVPVNADFNDTVTAIKNVFNSSPLFSIAAYTQETSQVPQKAVDNAPNKITIRFFSPDDEAKAIALKLQLVAKGYGGNTISIENMMLRVSKLYPGYVEIWAK